MLYISVALLQLHYALAKGQHGLPHEVLNVTESFYEPAPTPSAIHIITTTAADCHTITVTQETYPSPTTTRTIHSIIFPSPDASPVEITAQSQVIGSYIPEMTWCIGPPIALLPVTAPPYVNKTTEYSTIVTGTGSCETVFAPVQTTVCATTLTGLASKITITNCDQEVTFSTECGFTLEAPKPVTTNYSMIIPTPTVRRLFTYWLAPWQSLTAGNTPSDVDVKICTTQDDESLECIRYQEVWEILVVTQTMTRARTVHFSTTVSGPGTLIVETLHATITDTIESVDLSTVLLLETEFETESTSTGRKPLPTVQSTQEIVSTVYITKHLHRRPTRTRTLEPVTTVWVTSIATRRISTLTVTRARPLPSLVEIVPEDLRL